MGAPAFSWFAGEIHPEVVVGMVLLAGMNGGAGRILLGVLFFLQAGPGIALAARHGPAFAGRAQQCVANFRGGIARIAFAHTPDLTAGVRIACEGRRPRWCITGSVNGATWTWRSKEQTMCIDNEPTKVRFL